MESDLFLPMLLAAACLIAVFLLSGLRNPILFFYAALFGTAILKTPELPVVREKFTIVEVCLLLLWFSWSLLATSSKPEYAPGRGVIRRWGGLFGVVCLISSLLAIATTPPEITSNTRVIGSLVEAVNYCYGVAIAWTCIQVLDSWQRWVGAVVAWIGGMALAAFVGTAAVVGIAPAWAREETGRICSTLRNENQVPSMILPLLTVMIMIAVRRGLPTHYRILAIVVVAAALVTGIGTGSRTAALMIVLAGVGIYWVISTSGVGTSSIYPLQLANLAVVFTVSIVFYFVFAWSQYDGRYSLMSTPSWQRPAVLLIEWFDGSRDLDNTRPQQIAAAIDQFWNSPLLGTGPKWGGALASTGGEVHNTYFSLLLETGMLGLGAYLALLLATFSLSYRAAKYCSYSWYSILGRALLVGLVLLCLYNSTMLGLRQRNIWFLLGILLAYCDLVFSGAVPVWRPVRGIPDSLYSLFIASSEYEEIWGEQSLHDSESDTGDKAAALQTGALAADVHFSSQRSV